MSGVQGGQGNSVVLKFERLLRDWLVDEGGARVDIDYHAIHRTGRVKVWLICGEERKSVHLPREVSFAMHDIRAAQADPRRGAWLYSHFWMEAAEGVLHQNADWMCEPVISASPIVGADAVVELEYYPRDPEWMATKAAAHQEVRDARERRRQRDRERRAKQKAEADQAEGASGSGRSGE